MRGSSPLFPSLLSCGVALTPAPAVCENCTTVAFQKEGRGRGSMCVERERGEKRRNSILVVEQLFSLTLSPSVSLSLSVSLSCAPCRCISERLFAPRCPVLFSLPRATLIRGSDAAETLVVCFFSPRPLSSSSRVSPSTLQCFWLSLVQSRRKELPLSHKEKRRGRATPFEHVTRQPSLLIIIAPPIHASCFPHPPPPPLPPTRLLSHRALVRTQTPSRRRKRTSRSG